MVIRRNLGGLKVCYVREFSKKVVIMLESERLEIKIGEFSMKIMMLDKMVDCYVVGFDWMRLIILERGFIRLFGDVLVVRV